MNSRAQKRDAILAGLACLQDALEQGDIQLNDGGIGSILTNFGEHPGWTAEGVELLYETIERLNNDTH